MTAPLSLSPWSFRLSDNLFTFYPKLQQGAICIVKQATYSTSEVVILTNCYTICTDTQPLYTHLNISLSILETSGRRVDT